MNQIRNFCGILRQVAVTWNKRVRFIRNQNHMEIPSGLTSPTP